jgi:L-2-hydroxyglutarate oxidase LhgO
MKVVVIGAGLFGCCSAIELARAGFHVVLLDREDDIMQKASRVNHNRIHLGYHYLRSVETAEQSIEGLLSFLFNYGKAVEPRQKSFSHFVIRLGSDMISSIQQTPF